MTGDIFALEYFGFVWYPCYYLHTSRDSVSPVFGISMKIWRFFVIRSKPGYFGKLEKPRRRKKSKMRMFLLNIYNLLIMLFYL